MAQPMTISPLVRTESLTKRYRNFAALENCSLSVERGEVFGLLGPNGAGKTTLLRLLLGYLRPTSGRAMIDGLDCQRASLAVRRRVSYLPGEARFPRGMRGRDVLRFLVQVRDAARLSVALDVARRLELDLARRVAFMSTGMRQKLALAVTLAADAPLLILDEPTANLDPTVRGVVLEMVQEARRAGRTVVFSSHVLSEIEEVCDRVVILRDGRLVHTQVMAELRQMHRVEATLIGPAPALPDSLRGDASLRTPTPGALLVETASLSPLLGWLADLPVSEMRIEPIGLRAVYDRFHQPDAAPRSQPATA